MSLSLFEIDNPMLVPGTPTPEPKTPIEYKFEINEHGIVVNPLENKIREGISIKFAEINGKWFYNLNIEFKACGQIGPVSKGGPGYLNKRDCKIAAWGEMIRVLKSTYSDQPETEKLISKIQHILKTHLGA